MRQTIDGFVCSNDNDDSFLFAHIDEEALAREAEHLSRAGLHVMGRFLYQSMAKYWPTSDLLPATAMNEIPKAVFSRTLTDTTSCPVQVLRGDPVSELSKLEVADDKEILVHGGASLAQSLSSLNVIDEYRLLIHPVALGSGKPCITSPITLRLVSSHQFAASLAWYRDVLGFEVEREFVREGTKFAVRLRAGSVALLLSRDDGMKRPERIKGEGFSLQCRTAQSIDDLATRVKGQGVTLDSEPAEVWGARMFRVRDPDGFRLVISSER